MKYNTLIILDKYTTMLGHDMKHLMTIYMLLGFLIYRITFAKYEDESSRYCRICEQHTMCLYPFDDPSPTCKTIVNGDLDEEEIALIIDEHNNHRNHISSGQETRGSPGPQSPAKNMMELTWDPELAKIARRWALQCHLNKKDECRDVERFSVWQNVHVLNIDKLETDTTSHHRIPFHVQSWLDDVENFDTAEVGMVDFSSEYSGSYIGIAAGKISRIGCGRGLYSVETRQEIGVSPLSFTSFLYSTSSSSSSMLKDGLDMPGENMNVTVSNNVEVLVCNYGPIDRSTPRNLYDVGTPGYCPMGFSTSQRYEYLCTKTLERSKNENWYNQNKLSSSETLHSSTIFYLLIFSLYQSSLSTI